MNAYDRFSEIQSLIENIPMNEFSSLDHLDPQSRERKIVRLITDKLSVTDKVTANRVLNEFHHFGPLDSLFLDSEITEILVNDLDSLWIEKNGRLSRHNDKFFSDLSFRNILERISAESNARVSLEHPYADGSMGDFRVAIVGPAITKKNTILSFRRHPKNPWTFSKLVEVEWCSPYEASLLKDLMDKKKNFLVIGPTSSGKTSVLNSFLASVSSEERVLIIEDTAELKLPNFASSRLLTREDSQKILPTIDQSQLVRSALRLRPDRVVMGEMRGPEAKDFLLALATGHRGSFGTLHAEDPRQALVRLEMLIQLGAPQWDINAIRKMISFSLDYVVVTKKYGSSRKFGGIFRLASLEDQGFLLEQQHSIK